MKHPIFLVAALCAAAMMFHGCKDETNTALLQPTQPPASESTGAEPQAQMSGMPESEPMVSAPGTIGCLADWTPEYEGSPWVPPAGDLVLVERATGSRFNVLGQSITGSLADRKVRLKPLSKALNSFWFAWSVFWPGSEVWGRSEKVKEADIRSDANCEIPCNEIRLACSSGKDCIPALPAQGEEAPVWVDAASPEVDYLSDTDRVAGVFMNGVARAYPENILWWHEIANDTISAGEGVSKRFAVSFCPLTGSFAVYDRLQVEGRTLTYGVSGNLYNSNLVMFDRETETWWSQMRLQPIAGELRSPSRASARTCPFIETTWARWKAIFPDTRVLSSQTGFRRDYTRYPYNDYREDHSDTFRATNPPPDDLKDSGAPVLNKDLVYGVLVQGVDGNLAAKAYVWKDVQAKLGDRAVINDTVAGRPIVVIWDAENRMMVAYERIANGTTVEFDLASE